MVLKIDETCQIFGSINLSEKESQDMFTFHTIITGFIARLNPLTPTKWLWKGTKNGGGDGGKRKKKKKG